MGLIAQKPKYYEVSEQQLFVEAELEKLKIRDVWIKLWRFLNPVIAVFEARMVRKVGPGLPAEDFDPRINAMKCDQLGGWKW